MATEVIDLLSSEDDANNNVSNSHTNLASKTPNLARTTRPAARSRAAAAKAALLDDLDFAFDTPEISRRNKRRRLSPVNDPISSSNPSGLPSAPSRKPASSSKRPANAHDSDPIIFTSSLQPVRRKPKAAPAASVDSPPSSPIGGRSDEDLLDSSSPLGASDARLKETTANIQTTHKPKTKPDSQNAPSHKSRAGPSKPTSDEKERAKKDRAAARDAERARKQRETAVSKEEAAARKKFEREQKAREKQREKDLAEANRARHDKKVSTPEMIVDLPLSVQGKSVDTKVREMLKKLDVETTTYTSLLPNLVRWRRKVAVQFDEEAGHWVPVTRRVEQEPHVLCYVEAREFVGMVDEGAPDDEKLEAHVKLVKSKYAGAKVIYLLEGLEAWLRKGKNARNREFQAAARGDKPGNKNKTNGAAEVDEGTVEDALLRLQVVHDCFVYHTASTYESAEWIVHFTQHISTVPYRNVRDNISTSFCMDVGQVRTGEDVPDTHAKMLQQISRVTAPIAYGIMNEYPHVEALIKGYEEGGPNILEDLKKGANKNGGLSEARIGPAISRRLEKVLLGKDPASMDV